MVAAGAIFDELMDSGRPDAVNGTAALDEHAAIEIASTVKMLQNAMIGPVAIAVTIYW